MTEPFVDLQAVKDISRLQRQVTVEQAQATLQLASMTSGRRLFNKRVPACLSSKILIDLYSQATSVLLQRSRASCTGLVRHVHPAELIVHPF